MRLRSSLIVLFFIALLLLSIHFYDERRQSKFAMIEDTKMEFETMSEHPYGANNRARLIHERVDNGLMTWEDLGFTSDDVLNQERLAKVRLAELGFEKMVVYPYGAEYYAGNILKIIESGDVTWEELDFTSEDVVGRGRLAKIEAVKFFFRRIPFLPSMAERYANRIHEIIEGSDVTWDEVGFTSEDVVELERLAKTNNMVLEKQKFISEDLMSQERKVRVDDIRKYFESMITSPFIVEIYTGYIYEMIESGDVTWKEAGFTSEDVVERERFIKKENAERYFDWILILPSRAENYADRIHEIIEDGNVTWEELGFTSRDVLERKRMAKTSLEY